MINLPEYISEYKIVKRGRCGDHRFCSYCGKEITKLNLKDGSLSYRQHFVCKTVDGFEVYLCWRRDNCENKRRKKYD